MIGMYWFDNSNDDLVTRVGRALAYYRSKYQEEPKVVIVHPSEAPITIEGLEIRQSKSVLPKHIFVSKGEV